MSVPLTFLLTAVLLLSASRPAYAQRSKPLVCKNATLAALKPRPELNYQCDEQLNAWDEKVLKLTARVTAIKSLVSELSSFTEPAWWAADVVDLSVCDFTDKPGTLTRDQRRSFLDGEYLF
jgi:hypothetical protein